MVDDSLVIEEAVIGKTYKFNRLSLEKSAFTGKPKRIVDSKSARNYAHQVIQASIKAVDPQVAVKKFLKRKGNIVTVSGRRYNLADYDEIKVFGAGKASAYMAKAVVELIPEVSDGLVIVKDEHGLPGGEQIKNVVVKEARHPRPNQTGLDSTNELIEKAVKSSQDSKKLFIVVKSGGGSALLEKLAGDLTLNDLEELTDALQSKPLTIEEVNSVRKHVSSVKGGQLAKIFSENGADTLGLILSDMIGDKLEVIASGPTVPDTTTYQDALNVIEKHNLTERLEAKAPQVLRHLKRGKTGEIPETPEEDFPNVFNVVIGNNRLAAEAAAQKANQLGFTSYILEDELTDEVVDASRGVFKIASDVAKSDELNSPVCLILGGETTVELGESPGKGGRNQDLAVRAGIFLEKIPNVLIAHYGTDGTDGNNDAAGGFADSQLISMAKSSNLDPEGFLDRNDTYNLLSQLGDNYHIVLGPTGTIVCDITLILVWPGKERR